MIYLIIDTNIWLYMANGFDSITKQRNVGDTNHITFFQQLKSKCDSGEFKIVVSDIILDEWKRNKSTSLEHIKALKKEKKKRIGIIVQQKDSLPSKDFESRCEEINKFFDQKIELNRKHIEKVEELLHSSERIEISDNLKLEVIELALKKEKAPFHNNKNNIADALILFGAIEFLKSHLYEYIEKAVFVSNNYNDFGQSKETNHFHRDIVSRIGNLQLEYHRHFLSLLDITEDLQDEIDLFHELKYESNFYFECLIPDCKVNEDISGYGFLEENIRIADSKENQDPYQQELFDLNTLIRYNIPIFVKKGCCKVCKTAHVQCPKCKSLLVDINGSEQYFCNECEKGYQRGISPTHGDNIIYLIPENDFHL